MKHNAIVDEVWIQILRVVLTIMPDLDYL